MEKKKSNIFHNNYKKQDTMQTLSIEIKNIESLCKRLLILQYLKQKKLWEFNKDLKEKLIDSMLENI